MDILYFSVYCSIIYSGDYEEHDRKSGVKTVRMKGAHRVSSLVLALVAFVITTKGVYGAQHAVGGSQGWEESVDLNSWASGQTFKVGDQLGMCCFVSFNINHPLAQFYIIFFFCQP